MPATISELPNVKHIRNDRNRGFAAAINQGLTIAEGEYLVWLNNDTLPSHRWISQLIQVLRSDTRYGVVGPVSNRVIPEQKITVQLATPAQIHRFTDQHNQVNQEKWRESKRLSGFCLVYSRKIHTEIGFLDERFGLGTFEDDDYCYRVRKAGYRCMVAGDTYVHHFGSRSFQQGGYPEFQKILLQNKAYFHHKWDLPYPDEGDKT